MDWILIVVILFLFKFLQLRVFDFKSLHMEFGRPLRKEPELKKAKRLIKGKKKTK